MQWIKKNRAAYILSKFGAANTADTFTDTIRSCSLNISLFDVSNLTTIWESLSMYWVNDVGLVSVIELLNALKGREMDIALSLSSYYIKTGRFDEYTAKSFSIFKKSLLVILQHTVPEANILIIKSALTTLFPQDNFPSAELNKNVFSIAEIAHVAAKLQESTSASQLAVVDHMRILHKNDFREQSMETYRPAILNVHALLHSIPNTSIPDTRRTIIGRLYIFFGDLNIFPADDLALNADTISFLQSIDNLADPRLGGSEAGRPWFIKASFKRSTHPAVHLSGC